MKKLLAAVAALLVVAGAANWWSHRDSHHYLNGETGTFVALFAAPPAPGSAQTRGEIEELLRIERTRNSAQVLAAQTDRKTEVERFFGALGFDPNKPPDLPRVRRLMDRVETDIRPYVRAAKINFQRARPFEVDQRLHPCIDHVRGDQSYPSGHATYGYVVTGLLAEMVPERRRELQARGDEFARQRMVCGVHFRSDLEAGRQAARWLLVTLNATPDYRDEMNAARAELRSALHLPPMASGTR
jgi:acid phosphatase (class A)